MRYIESKENFLTLFLRHINTSAIIDVLLRLLTTIENNDLRNQVIQWLKRIEIIKHIINLFDYKYNSLYHSNASQLICDIIRISREQILNTHEQNLENKSIQTDNDLINTNELIKNMYHNSLLEEIES